MKRAEHVGQVHNPELIDSGSLIEIFSNNRHSLGSEEISRVNETVRSTDYRFWMQIWILGVISKKPLQAVRGTPKRIIRLIQRKVFEILLNSKIS